MTNYKHGSRPTIGVLAGWQFYEGDVHGFLGLALSGIHLAAQEQDCNLLIACGVGHATGLFNGSPAWPDNSSDGDFTPVGPWNTDGLIVINPLLRMGRIHYIQQVEKAGHPIVFVGTGEEGRAVVPDNESGIRQAVAHLVQHGYRRIAFIAGRKVEEGKENEDEDSIERLQAYQAAVREYGLEEDPNLIVYGSHNLGGGRQAMKQLLESGVSFRAVLASNDESAYGAMQVLKEANLRIPQDVAIIGFDDWLETAGQEPPLTTIHYPIVDAGKKALTLLLETIRGHSTGNEIVKVPVHLIVRDSCGCQPGVLSVAATSPSQMGADTTVVQLLIRSMVEAIQRETRFLASQEVELLCRQLVEAFIRSLEENDAMIFRAAFLTILRRAEDLGDAPSVWYSALSLLKQSGAQLSGTWEGSSARQAEAMLNQAGMDISADVQTLNARYISRMRKITDQIGILTSRLFTAIDNSQVFEMLREFLPRVGIDRAVIGMYETQGDDPVAWSRLYPISSSNQAPLRFPSRQFPPDGLYPQEKSFRVVLFPLWMPQDQVIGFIAFDRLDLATYVTLVRHLAASFRGVQLYQEATEGRKLAEDANQLKSRFLASVSHELRTPLNLIVGLSEMLLEEGGEGNDLPVLEIDRKDMIQIHSSAQHLGWLIRDVLDLASSQSGQLRLTNGPVDMRQVLAVVAAAGEQLAREKGLAWEADLPADLPVLWGDQTRLTQVGLNLVSNAVKFTEEGGISLRAWVEGRTLVVEVTDTGLGIPAGEQQLIFNEFRQSERTSQRGYGGLGLGLAICKRLVELHGGEIGVRSSGDEHSGSTFYFRLPIVEEALPRAEGLRRAVVAVVAVEALEQGERLRAHLEQEGYMVEVCLADEGGQWLAGLLANAPQAVVLDGGVAARQGWEVLKTLKSNPQTQATPVLFYMLKGESGSMLSLDYLSKPLSPQALTAALELQGLATANEAAKTVLVVDDEPGILEMHVRVVAGLGEGYKVLKARNGREALEAIRDVRPDLVLLDLMMPELDGFGVLEAMRAGETTRDIPVIVLTAQVLTESDMLRLNRGVTTVLEKGMFSAAETLEHVRSALARGRRMADETQRLVRKAMAYIHEHYAEEITRADIASYVNVSPRHLTHCFDRETGLSPMLYLNRYRVRQAKILLLDSEKSITKIALEVGFSNSSYFGEVFRKEVRQSPQAYRVAPMDR